MKKINTLLKNENVMAAVVISAVFILTAAVTVFAIYVD